MERKNVVKRLLESMFENNDLISATFDVKSGLSVVNLRFDHGAILDPTSEPTTYVKKSRYHAGRDRERSELHRQSKRERKQTKFYDASTENPRFPDHENIVLSATGQLSPCSVYTDAKSPTTPHFCMTESPDPKADATQESAKACSPSLFSAGTQCDFPTVHDIVQMESTSLSQITPEDELVNVSLPQLLPECMDNPSFKSHLNEVGIDWSLIKCHDCMKNLYECETLNEYRRMAYCQTCAVYYCEQCNQDPDKLDVCEFCALTLGYIT